MGESDKKKKKNMYFIDSHGEIDPLYLILNTHTHTHIKLQFICQCQWSINPDIHVFDGRMKPEHSAGKPCKHWENMQTPHFLLSGNSANH